MKIQITTQIGETLTDAILRVHGKVDKGAFEETLSLNPHLLYLPLKIPTNTPIILNKEQDYNEKEIINLWD